MSLPSNDKQIYLDALIEAKKPVQLGLRGSPEPVGPGACELVEGFTTLYRLHLQAHMPDPNNPKAKPRAVTVPMIFDVSDVLVFLEPPVTVAGQTGIVVPAGAMSPGGIHLVGKDG